jgi:hypothetical protein
MRLAKCGGTNEPALEEQVTINFFCNGLYYYNKERGSTDQRKYFKRPGTGKF